MYHPNLKSRSQSHCSSPETVPTMNHILFSTTQAPGVSLPSNAASYQRPIEPDTSIQPVQQEEHRRGTKRKGQRLRAYCQRRPRSFTHLLDRNWSDSDNESDISESSCSSDEEGEKELPQKILIRVDEKLGLAAKTSEETEGGRNLRRLRRTNSRIPFIKLTPKEQGFYEGVMDLSLPEDVVCLPASQVWIRQQMQLFTLDGRVGVRCRHCPEQKTFPNTVTLLHNTCTLQTSALRQHVLSCPKVQVPSFSSPPRRTMPLTTYYAISARRLGLIDKDGIRFGRDPSLEPLPFDTIRLSTSAASTSTTTRRSNETSEPRVRADEDAERVLAQAVLQADTPEILGRSSDQELVSDFVFLAIKQLQVIHATPTDFASRGRRTKFLRLGLAGFCCRHCGQNRMFTSAADNLSSAITNSFCNHLLKCPNAKEISQALQKYKKLHSRQMNALPYGSQRQCFLAIWDRLREHDKSPEEVEAMEVEIKTSPPTEAKKLPTPEPVTSKTVALMKPKREFPTERPSHFRGSADPIVKSVLEPLLSEWDTSENVVLPEDLALISDYVFLTLRQMRIAVDENRTGLACRWCDGAQARSFPSAPDNFASAINTSLYNHLKVCPCLDGNVRHSLLVLKKMHSTQLASLVFGSQRHFFNRLYRRLQERRDEVPSTSVATGAGLPSGLTGFVSIGNGAFMCQACRMVPVQFRALNSIVEGPRLSELAKKHTIACHKEKFNVAPLTDMLVTAMAEFCESGTEAMDSPEFEDFANAVFGNDQVLKRAMTDIGIKEPIPGLWHRFCRQADCAAIKEKFVTFSRVHGRSVQMTPLLRNWLLLVAPGLDEGEF